VRPIRRERAYGDDVRWMGYMRDMVIEILHGMGLFWLHFQGPKREIGVQMTSKKENEIKAYIGSS